VGGARTRGDLALVQPPLHSAPARTLLRRAMRLQGGARRGRARAAPHVRDEELFFDTDLLVLVQRGAALRIHEVPVDGRGPGLARALSPSPSAAGPARRRAPGRGRRLLRFPWPSCRLDACVRAVSTWSCAMFVSATASKRNRAPRRRRSVKPRRTPADVRRPRAGGSRCATICSSASSSWLAPSAGRAARSRCCTTSSPLRRTSSRRSCSWPASPPRTLSATYPALWVFAERRHSRRRSPPLIALQCDARAGGREPRSPPACGRGRARRPRRRLPRRSARAGEPATTASATQRSTLRASGQKAMSSAATNARRPFPGADVRPLERAQRDQLQGDSAAQGEGLDAVEVVRSRFCERLLSRRPAKITIPATIGMCSSVRVARHARPADGVHRLEASFVDDRGDFEEGPHIAPPRRRRSARYHHSVVSVRPARDARRGPIDAPRCDDDDQTVALGEVRRSTCQPIDAADRQPP